MSTAEPVITISILVKSWQAACDAADKGEHLALTAPAAAGMLLAMHGTPSLAIARLPRSTGFWGRVAELIRRAGETEAKGAHPAADIEGQLRASLEVHKAGARFGVRTIAKGGR